MNKFRLQSQFSLTPPQAEVVDKLCTGFSSGVRHQTLAGVTGSGKTFLMANVIANLQRPGLVIAPNKILAAQLYQEFKRFFPDNAVEYFVSYYDYYQPEAYLPAQDLYIEKDASINDELDRMRLSATKSLLEREDVVIVASVSCIYGLGSPEIYRKMLVYVQVGEKLSRDTLLLRLVDIQYTRNDYDFHRGVFRVRGDVVEVFPAESEHAIRIEFFGDEIEAISRIDTVRGNKVELLSKIAIYPASHYVSPPSEMKHALNSIREELAEQLIKLHKENKLLEAQRLEQRTNFDLEMMEETGFCKGIENYSRWLHNRKPGSPPQTLIDYFPTRSLLFVDESHVSFPQLAGMSKGDQARKKTLVAHGFRLPSALDNRPLTFEEYQQRIVQAIYLSATPGPYERKISKPLELLIRPTGLLDPPIKVLPANQQIDLLLHELRLCSQKNERVLIITLTKRMAEDIATYYEKLGIKICWMHSEVNALERAEIIRNLRSGAFDVLVGINLLREGLDLPEVSLVAILDADKEGFLRSERSLMQTCGRAARHEKGRIIFYAEKITPSMQSVINETNRRRNIQQNYNKKHHITPRAVQRILETQLSSAEKTPAKSKKSPPDTLISKNHQSNLNWLKDVKQLEKSMKLAAKNLKFEQAADIRDEITRIKKENLGIY